ncbi:MAG: PAS domain S-box protein [Chloroflexi bacterium]|nr:PAS domain S-box protein [Chloroflexota bacterium]MCI0578489.1 PAS domain S-box protein [Chloroflexota bacterium]MCI0648494.1 PAS domain S-box protein [Chloroflexota bacterium]MCI0726018.1 PAS domain S-box protein [Chloroflexota bacterium]
MGLNGTLALLDEQGKKLTFRAVAFPGHLLQSLEEMIGFKGEGLSFTTDEDHVYRRLVTTKEAFFVADISGDIAPVLPLDVRQYAKEIAGSLGEQPGIYAPLLSEGHLFGTLAVFGPGLSAADVPAIVAFANHIAVALENARLFQAMHRAEVQYRRLFETSNDAIVVINPQQRRIISANPRAELLTGYSEAELQAMPLSHLAPAGYLEEARHIFDRIIQGEQHAVETRLIRHDGRELSVQVFATIFALEGQRLLQGVLHDVTDYRQAEEALRQSEERFHILANNAPAVIYLCQNNYTFNMLYLNDAVETLTGYPKEEFLENRITFRDIYHPDDSPFILPEDDEELKRQGSFQLSYRIRHRSGEWRWVEDYGGGVFDDDGRLLFLAGFISDITKRKQAEEALQESQRALSTLISNLPGMVYRCRNDRRWSNEFVSDGSIELTGYRPEEFIGGQVYYGDLIHPDDRDRVWNEVQEALARRQPFRLSYRVYHKDGREKWVWEQGQGVYSSEGEVLALEGFITDITERKQAEEALRHGQKMESLGILAGGVAHDFNNLLVAMLGQTSLALLKLPPENSARQHVEKAVKAAERASDLTRQLLAYSGRGQFTHRPIDLNAFLRESTPLLEVSLPKHVQLRWELADPLVAIEGDLGQIQQVVMNLVLNAAEAIGDRPGAIVITTGERLIGQNDNHYWRETNDPLKPGQYIFLKVADDGSGMDDNTLGKIFDPFFTTKFTGRGLGLAAVLGIMRGHKGGVSVSSQVGQGTTFELLFPVSEAEVARLPILAPAQPVRKQPGAVLVIDDEAAVREAASDILELEGLRVIAAADGLKGIHLYQEQAADIDLVLLDLSMPGLSGEETFRELQRLNPQVQVILSSGYSAAEVNRAFQGRGIAGFIQKPYDWETLASAVWRHLDSQN